MSTTEEYVIYNLEKIRETAERKLLDSGIPQGDKDLILEYIRHRALVDNIGRHRQYKYMTYLRIMGEWLGKPYTEATKRDIENLVCTIKTVKRKHGEKEVILSSWSQHDYFLALKSFFEWLNGGKEPEETAWIKVIHPGSRRLTPDEILTWNDVVVLSQHAIGARDQALPQVLWDSGFRIEELLSMRYKDVEVLNHGSAARLTIRKSKTELRNPVVVRSAPALVRWLQDHPTKNPDSPLWCMRDGRILQYSAARKILMELKARCGLCKPVNPHQFRKSSASFYSHHLTPSELKARFGWDQSSRMLDVYCFPDQDEVNRKIMRMHNIPTDEKEKVAEELKPKECFWCHTSNPAGQRVCMNKVCNRSLNPEDYLVPQQFIEAYDKRDNSLETMLVDIQRELRELKEQVQAGKPTSA